MFFIRLELFMNEKTEFYILCLMYVEMSGFCDFYSFQVSGNSGYLFNEHPFFSKMNIDQDFLGQGTV